MPLQVGIVFLGQCVESFSRLQVLEFDSSLTLVRQEQHTRQGPRVLLMFATLLVVSVEQNLVVFSLRRRRAKMQFNCDMFNMLFLKYNDVYCQVVRS